MLQFRACLARSVKYSSKLGRNMLSWERSSYQEWLKTTGFKEKERETKRIVMSEGELGNVQMVLQVITVKSEREMKSWSWDGPPFTLQSCMDLWS